MKKITVYCNSNDGDYFTVDPGGKDDSPAVLCGKTILLDIARIRELKKYFTRLEREVAKRPKPDEEKPKKWMYGEEES